MYEDLIEKQEELIFAMSDETESPTLFTRNYFEIIKEKETGVYYFNLLYDEREEKYFISEKLPLIKEAMNKFASTNNIKVDSLELDDIYDFTSITSSYNLDELFAKFKMVCNYFIK